MFGLKKPKISIWKKLLLLFYSLMITFPVAAQDFTVVILPDTQKYSQNYPTIFINQTQWIVANKDALNIVYVAHEGDIVNTSNSTEQWDNAVAAMSLLENPVTTGLPDGIPYGVVPGNHDQPTENYNTYFGVSHFWSKDYYGDSYISGLNDSNYTFFSASGMDFIVINFEYGSPPNDLLDWANNLLKIYSNHRAIVVTHSILWINGSFDQWGKQIYDALKNNPNLFLMLCGHNHGEAIRREEHNGNTIHILLADYQDQPNGGNGWLRIMEFSPENDEITVTTYSPSLDQYGADTVMGVNTTSEPFTISYDMNIAADSSEDTSVVSDDGGPPLSSVDGGPSQSSDGSGITRASAGGDGDGGCFIATAAYGSLMEPHVKILRDFRDRFLLGNTAGDCFIHFYYAYSPPIADFIAKHDVLRVMVSLGLLPIVGMSWVSLKFGPIFAVALMLIFISCFVGLIWLRRRYKE